MAVESGLNSANRPNFGFGGAEGGTEYTYDDEGLLDTYDALSAEFRHRLGLLPEEEEGLTEAFKARIGLSSPCDESSRELNEILIPIDIEKEATLAKFKFSQFVQSNFTNAQTCSFMKEPLKQPLLAKTNEVDKMASIAISTAIKRFCKDINFSAVAPAVYADGTSVMSVIYNTFEVLSRRLQRNDSNPGKQSQPQSPTESEKQIKKRHSLKKLFRSKSSSNGDSSSDLNGILKNIPTEELDLVQFIVGHGILRRELRNEIYCQLCCQVTNNSSIESTKKTWMLHVVCAECFMPSQDLLKFYFSFLSDVSADYKEYAIYTKKILYRTNSCGLRYHPTTWLEYQAAKIRKHIMLPVSLPDGRTESVECDSAMTASEICFKISASINLKEQFGFAIYIVIMDKVSSLGNGSDHVMDAIAECEQFARIKGRRAEESPWQLFFRKELFTPWHDAEYDPVGTELIYQQIIRSVQAEEYRLRSEEELARFIARRWYIEEGKELETEKLEAKLKEFLPKSLFTAAKSREKWPQSVATAFVELGFNEGKNSREEAKASVVAAAQRKWPLQFSALFEAFRISGPPLPKNEIILALSCRGVFFIEEPYRILMALHYYEIVDVICGRSGQTKAVGREFSLITIKGEEWKFFSPNSEAITKLIGTFLDGLRRRSRWAVALQQFILEDHTRDGEDAHFCLMQGDVVELMDETKRSHLKEDWMYGRCEQTGLCGSFPYDSIYIFPTCEKPPAEFLALFSVMSSADVSTLPRKRGAVVLGSATIGRSAGHGIQSAI